MSDDPIPQEWVRMYIEQLKRIADAILSPTGRTIARIRVEHAEDLLKVFRSRNE